MWQWGGRGPERITTFVMEISIQGKGALPVVQLSISFFISCFGKYDMAQRKGAGFQASHFPQPSGKN